jgi:hypothetical protein
LFLSFLVVGQGIGLNNGFSLPCQRSWIIDSVHDKQKVMEKKVGKKKERRGGYWVFQYMRQLRGRASSHAEDEKNSPPLVYFFSSL